MWVYRKNKFILGLSFFTFLAISAPVITTLAVRNNESSYENKNQELKTIAITTWNTNKLIYDQSFSNKYSSAYDSDRKVKEYVVANLSRFVANLPSEFNNEDVVISQTTVSHEAGTVNFKIGLKKYITDNGLQSDNGDVFTSNFTLTGFKTINNPANLPTALAFSTLSIDSMLYKNIFQIDKGFQVDWSGEFTYRAQAIKSYMNNHIQEFFVYPSSTVVNSVAIFSSSVPSSLVVDVNFSGKVNGVYQQSISGQFQIIDLKTTPDFSKNSKLWEIINLKANELTKRYENQLENYKFEITKDLKIELAGFLNNNINQIPNKALPPSHFFGYEQIIGEISFDQNNNIIGTGFCINNNRITINLPNGNFNKFSKFRQELPQWVGYLIIIAGAIGLLLLLLLVVLFVVKQRKKYRNVVQNKE